MLTARKVKAASGEARRKLGGQFVAKAASLKDTVSMLKISVAQTLDGMQRDLGNCCREVVWRVSEYSHSHNLTSQAATHSSIEVNVVDSMSILRFAGQSRLQTALKSARKQWEAEFSLREQRMTQTVREYELSLQDMQTQLATQRSQLLSEQTALSDSDRRLTEARVRNVAPCDGDCITALKYVCADTRLLQVSFELTPRHWKRS